MPCRLTHTRHAWQQVQDDGDAARGGPRSRESKNSRARGVFGELGYAGAEEGAGYRRIASWRLCEVIYRRGPCAFSISWARTVSPLAPSTRLACPPFALQAAGETATSFYNLSDNVFVQAKIVPEDKVAIWLGVRCVALCVLRPRGHAGLCTAPLYACD